MKKMNKLVALGTALCMLFTGISFDWSIMDTQAEEVTGEGLGEGVSTETEMVTDSEEDAGTADVIADFYLAVGNDKKESLDMTVDDEVTLTAVAAIDGGGYINFNGDSGYTIEWTIEDETIVEDTVQDLLEEDNNKLMLQALAAGETTVTAVVNDENGDFVKQASCEITVAAKEEPIEITGFYLAKDGVETDKFRIASNEAVTLVAEVQTSGADIDINDYKDYSIVWTVGNDNIVSIAGEGTSITATGLVQGETSITAALCKDGVATEFASSCEVYVDMDIPAEDDGETDQPITVDSFYLAIDEKQAASYNMLTGEEVTIDACAVTSDDGALYDFMGDTSYTIAWSIDDLDIIDQVEQEERDDNCITVVALTSGIATVTAQVREAATGDLKYTAACRIAVSYPKITSFELASDDMVNNKITVIIEDELDISASAMLETGEELDFMADNGYTIEWSIEDEGIIEEVDKDEEDSNYISILAIDGGETTITATVYDENGNETQWGGECTVSVYVPVDSIELEEESIYCLKGKSVSIGAEIYPENATNSKITWKSSNTKVAKVDAKGKVTAVAKGTAIITATGADESEAECEVIVPEVKLNVTTTTVQVGKTTTAVKISSRYPKEDEVDSYTSSNKKIATVTAKGVVKGIKAGTATITIKMESGVTATYKVKVQNKEVVTTKLTMSEKSQTIELGKTVALTVTRNPVSAKDKITWTTSNSEVATVTSAGKVKAVGPGKATITATASGKKATCKITVPASITLKSAKATLKKGKKTTIVIKKMTLSTDKVSKYTSSNKKVAAVTSKGVVTAKSKGTAKITVKMKSGATAVFTVTVK